MIHISEVVRPVISIAIAGISSANGKPSVASSLEESAAQVLRRSQSRPVYRRTNLSRADVVVSRAGSDKQVREIAQSIESFGFNAPLLIEDENKIIAGHGRLLAARKLGGVPYQLFA